MLRYLTFASLACIMLGSLLASATAQQTPTGAVKEIVRLNPLIESVARNDPDGLRSLLRRLEILTTGQRDGGPSRSGATPTVVESAQISANPLLIHAYANDHSATLALLRATNDELDRARRRDPLEPRRRIALVIGNTGDRPWGILGTVRNDAVLVADALTRQGFELFAGHPSLDLDRRQLVQTIRDFSQSITPGTVAIVYYAGHGVRAGGRNFLVPADAAVPTNDDDYDRGLVAVDDMLLRPMQQADGALNIIVLDACQDRSASASAGTPRQSVQRSVRGFAPPDPQRSGTIVISSTGPNDVASDSVGHASHSPFAIAFAEAIREPGLDIRDVFDRMETVVDRATNHQQQSWITYSAIGRFYFSAPATAADNPPNVIVDDTPFRCPAVGTTVTLDVPGGPLTGAYETTDPADPVMCRIVTSSGKVSTLLYNFFDARSMMGQASVRTGMDSLLSKHTDQVQFDISYAGLYRVTEIWKRMAVETLVIGDRYVRTIRFERTRTMLTTQWNVAIETLIWYDPASGLFVKSEFQGPSGSTPTLEGGVPGAFKVISLKPG